MSRALRGRSHRRLLSLRLLRWPESFLHCRRALVETFAERHTPAECLRQLCPAVELTCPMESPAVHPLTEASGSHGFRASTYQALQKKVVVPLLLFALSGAI